MLNHELYVNPCCCSHRVERHCHMITLACCKRTNDSCRHQYRALRKVEAFTPPHTAVHSTHATANANNVPKGKCKKSLYISQLSYKHPPKRKNKNKSGGDYLVLPGLCVEGKGEQTRAM